MTYSEKLIKICKTKSGNQIVKRSEYIRLLESETSFLMNCAPVNRIAYVLLDLHEPKFCEICNKVEVTYNNQSKTFSTCSRSCGAKRSRLSMNKIDLDTGLSIIQSSINKRKKTLSILDPISGLTKWQSMEKNRQKTMSEIDPETGLRRSQISGKATQLSLNKIDPETGLSPSKAKEIKRHKTMSEIDPETGLTRYHISRKAQHKTMSEIDPETGLTRYHISRKAQHKTMSEIDPETGLSGIDIMNNKSKYTKSKIDPETGLTMYQLGELNRQKTMSEIDPETGLTYNKLTSIKREKTMSEIDPETGLNIRDITSIKIKNTSRKNHIIQKNINFPTDYKLLTSIDQYIKAKNSILKYSCNKCDSIRESYWPYIRCIKCYPYNKSIAENEILEYCQSLSCNILSNSRSIIKPLELDIYLPDHNLAIEYNGLFWHSYDSTEAENKDYHLNKTTLCQEKGIQLFHIFENEWINPVKQAIWKSIIKNRLGQSSRIYARKTTVVQITSKVKKQFLIDNHLQGDCASSVNLGLYLDDELVSVMTFGRSRYDKKIDWELLRFCNKAGYSIIGGASKLLKAFRRENDGSIISYADKRRSTGDLYKTLGFELSHESKPNYWYWKNNSMKLESRIKYQKHKLEKVLDKFDDGLTETENMYENGYRKIYDCGNQVWKMGQII